MTYTKCHYTELPTPLRTPQTSGHSSFRVSNLPLWSLKSPSSQWLKLSFFICPRVSARFLHCFCTPAGKPCFSLHCLHSVHRGGTCRGEVPPSCWRKTVLLLKSLTGAFIAALRSQTRIFPYFFQANSRRVNSRRCSGFICRTTFSIPSGVIWMLSGRFSFTGTRKSCLEHMWVADMEFAVAPEIVDSSPPKSPFSLHRKQDHASD